MSNPPYSRAPSPAAKAIRAAQGARKFTGGMAHSHIQSVAPMIGIVPGDDPYGAFLNYHRMYGEGTRPADLLRHLLIQKRKGSA